MDLGENASMFRSLGRRVAISSIRWLTPYPFSALKWAAFAMTLALLAISVIRTRERWSF